jgi:hypothetical protein
MKECKAIEVMNKTQTQIRQEPTLCNLVRMSHPKDARTSRNN